MPFGKFRGYQVEDIEPQYLFWLFENVPLREPLKTIVFNTLETRSLVPVANDKIKTAYRELAMKYHPDRGGKKETMQAVNESYKRIR